MEVIQINGIQEAYTRMGQGVPLVLIHGYPLDHTIWYDMVSSLENDFTLILPDLRGFGLSSVVESQYTIADMASDIAGLLDLARTHRRLLDPGWLCGADLCP